MGKPVGVNEKTFEAEVLQADLPVLTDFWAAWCAPCRRIAPILEDLAAEYAGKLKVAKVDVDANPTLADRYNVRSIPTLAVFRGRPAGRTDRRLRAKGRAEAPDRRRPEDSPGAS